MLTLLGPKLLAQQARRFRAVELDDPTLGRCESVVAAALRDGPLARADLYRALENSGIRTTASRGLHIIFALAHRRLICFGPRPGKQPTFILFDAWVRNSRDLEGDEAIHELALRYFRSHAPASVADFAWWSGLSMSEARRATEMLGKVRSRVARVTTKSMWLLPPFDEYLVAYKNRSDVLDPVYAGRVNAGGGLLNATIVANGEVVGTWKRSFKNGAVTITPALFRPLKKAEEARLGDAKSRYAAFLGMPLTE
jgi:hypothetical protein